MLRLISVNETLTTNNDTVSVTTVTMVEPTGESLKQTILQQKVEFQEIYLLPWFRENINTT